MPPRYRPKRTQENLRTINRASTSNARPPKNASNGSSQPPRFDHSSPAVRGVSPSKNPPRDPKKRQHYSSPAFLQQATHQESLPRGIQPPAVPVTRPAPEEAAVDHSKRAFEKDKKRAQIRRDYIEKQRDSLRPPRLYSSLNKQQRSVLTTLLENPTIDTDTRHDRSNTISPLPTLTPQNLCHPTTQELLKVWARNHFFPETASKSLQGFASSNGRSDPQTTGKRSVRSSSSNGRSGYPQYLPETASKSLQGLPSSNGRPDPQTAGPDTPVIT